MIYLVLVVAFLLRLVGISQSFWLDESIGVLEVSKNDISGILNQFLHVDNHPPLYYLTLNVWTNIFGYSEVAVRLLSVILGVATIYLVYKIALKVTQKEGTSLLAAALIAVSQFHVYYSQEARMYAMAAFFATLCVYLFLHLVERQNAKKISLWILFSVSLTALIFTDYMPLFLWPIFPLYALVRRMNRRWWMAFFIAHVPITFFGILWLPTFMIQTQGGKWLLSMLPSWKSVAGGASVKQAALVWVKFVLGRISLYNKAIYGFLVVLASIPMLVAWKTVLKNMNKYLIILYWAILPLALGFFISFIFPAFIYFRFTYVFPAFCLIAAIGLSRISSRLVKNFLVLGIFGVQFVSLSLYYVMPSQQREQWRQATGFIESKAGPDSLAIFEYPEPFTPYRWYENGKLLGVGATDSISATKEKTIKRTANLILGKKEVYYFEYLADLSDPQRYVIMALIDQGFVVSQEYGQFEGVGKISLWKKD